MELCTGADAQEPNNSFSQPRTFTRPAMQGTSCNGDEDWFVLGNAAGDEINILATASNMQALRVELYAPGPMPALVASGTQTLGGMVISVPSSRPGMLVRVVGETSVRQDYTLTITWLPVNTCPNDAYEPNNDQGTAKAVGAGAIGNICAMDLDWFHFDVMQPGVTAHVTMVPALSAGDIDLRVHTPDGRTFTAQASQGQTELLDVVAAVQGRYFVELYGFAGDTGQYSLTVTQSTGPSCQDDGFEENDSIGGNVPQISAFSGISAILCPMDPDVFMLVIPQAGTWTAQVDFLPGITVNGTLFSENGAPLQSNASSNGVLQLQMSVMTQTRLFLQLTSSAGSALDYRVFLSSIMMCSGQDNFEPNNSRTSASLYRSPSVSGVTCGGDEDWFRVDSLSGETVTFTLSGAAPQPDVFEVYNTQGTRVATGMPTPQGGFVALVTNAPGTLFARVVRTDSTESSFTLQINRINPNMCVPDNFEPNETQATARPYTGLVQAQICAGDRDFFSVVLPQGGGRITVDLFIQPGGGNLDVRLRGPNGGVLARGQQNGANPEHLEVMVNNAGTYVVEVYGAPEGSMMAGQAAYLLNVAVEPAMVNCVDDMFEDNDNAQNAFPISDGEMPLRLCNNDRDFFMVFLNSPGSLEVTLRYSAPPRMRLTVQDQNGFDLADSNNNMGFESILVENLAAGAYIIRVQGPSGDAQGRDYVLSTRVTGAQCMGDVGEPNEDTTQATPITFTSAINAVICAPEDIDHFAFTAVAGRAIEFRLETALNPDGPADAVIFSEQGQVIGQTPFGQGGTVKLIRADIRTSGRYFIQLFNSFGVPEPISYRISIRQLMGVLCTDDSFEENDGRAQARDIMRTAGGTTISARACPVDGEWYAFTMRAGIDVTISMASGMLDSDPQLVLYDPTGENPVAFGAANQQPIVFRPNSAGRYLLQVDYSFVTLPESGDAYSVRITP